MIFLIVIGVLILVYIALAFFAAKTWRVTHVLLMMGVFLMSLGFLILAAMALQTQNAWRTQYDQLASDLDTVRGNIAMMEQGDLLNPENRLGSLPEVTAELNRMLIDRGRVWRNTIPVQVGEGSITLGMSEWSNDRCARVGLDEGEDLEPIPDPELEGAGEAAAKPAAEPHQIVAGMVLFVFQELSITQFTEDQRQALFTDSELPSRDTQGVCRLPVYYLGNFNVTAVTEDTVTIEPILPLDEVQQQLVTAKQPTWALHETMPIDSHTIMGTLAPEQIQAVLTPPEILRALVNVPPESVAEITRAYVKDGQPAEPGALPERTGQMVKFLKDHEIAVDVEGEEGGTDKSYDPSGRALLSYLRQGRPTQFEAGQEAFFDSVTASRLKQQGIVEFLDQPPVYVRSLRSYDYDFHQAQDQLDRLADEIRVREAETASVQAALEKAREQITYRNEELNKLRADLAAYRQELEVVSRLARDLAGRVATQQAAMSALYRRNLRLAAELSDY